jgi:hypothetical protein
MIALSKAWLSSHNTGTRTLEALPLRFHSFNYILMMFEFQLLFTLRRRLNNEAVGMKCSSHDFLLNVTKLNFNRGCDFANLLTQLI